MAVCLFIVESHDRLERGIALLPGVPPNLFSNPDVTAIRQGTPLELRLPDGTRRETVIEDYRIQASVPTL